MRQPSVLDAFAALAVHFQPMAAHSEARGGSGFPEHVLCVPSLRVRRRSAYRAQQVVVAPLLADLVAQFVIFQQSPTRLTGSTNRRKLRYTVARPTQGSDAQRSAAVNGRLWAAMALMTRRRGSVSR